MIRYVDAALLPSLLALLDTDNSLYACRIGCLLESYGLGYPFAEFYLQLNDREQPVGAAVRYYHDMTLLLTGGSDTDEWRSMVPLLGVHSLLCDRPLLTDRPAATLRVMALTQTPMPPAVPEGMTVTDQPDLKALWSLLKSCEAADFAVPAYEDFLPDVSHKLRHGTAACCVLQQAQRPVAAAMTVAQTKHSALIGGVATDPHFRRQGLGAWCVRTLCHTLAGRRIYLMRDPNRHARFYEQCGFEDTAACTLTY